MRQYVVDAFTNRLFHGNQAAVCVLDGWPSETLMMDVTRENNFSETAFAVRRPGSQDADYDLRWFTPGGEISLCGHATLATAYVLLRFYDKDAGRITFHTMSGDLFVGREGELLVMDFPAYGYRPVPVTPEMADALGHRPSEAYVDRDLLLVYEDESVVRGLAPDFDKVRGLPGEGVGVTAPGGGSGYDCVSRFFDPKLEVDEDPVTGSIHCMIAPYWAARLGRDRIRAYQASSRGGELVCEVRGDRVTIAGSAALYSVAELEV